MQKVISCPSCHGSFEMCEAHLFCRICQKRYARGEDGFFSFIVDHSHNPQQKQQEEYVKHQETYPIRVYREFLKPLISVHPARTVLDVGCGLGIEVEEASKDGYDAYGIDLPNMGPFWHSAGRDPSRFFKGSAVRLPFRDGSFDFIWSLGVVEHIGTSSDTATLLPDYRQARRDYANELVRVTRPGGTIVVSCPNKSFPIDIQHGPTCGGFNRLRWHIFNKTRLNLHKTWGKYHLLSYLDAKRLFLRNRFVQSVQPLPLKHYFGFNAFQSGYLGAVRSMVTCYVEALPRFLLPTFLNPYMLIMVRKSAEQDVAEAT